MGEATIGSMLLVFLFLLMPIIAIRIFRSNERLLSTNSPLSLLSIIFAGIATILYFVCLVYTDKIKKLDDPTQDLINTRNWIFNSSMVSIGLCILLLLLSLKYE